MKKKEMYQINFMRAYNRLYGDIFNWSNPEALYKVCMDQDKEIERLNNIINEMEQFFIDNANDEMKKCFDKLHELKGIDKEEK